MRGVLLTMLEAGEPRPGTHAPQEEAEPEVEVEPVAGPSTAPGPAAKRPSLLLSVHEEIMQENSDAEQLLASPLAVQVQSYQSELPIKKTECPLTYWRVNKHRFPALAPLARAYLSAPCTSVDSERLFSLVGHVIDERRSRLAGDKAEMLLFLKKNLLMSK